MNILNVSFTLALCLAALSGFGQTRGQPQQTSPPQSGSSPIYRITVVGRTIPSVKYSHQSEPTKIDFRGTVLQPHANGEAKVVSQRGSTVIDAEFEELRAPTAFGAEYLTYVLWAITPEGRPVNLGEVVLDPSNKAKLHVTADLQAFGLIVTAEPYYSVTQPSDVVVLENVVRPDTKGKVETVDAKYELLPRGRYTFDQHAAESQPQGKKVSMDEYEAVLALYQAQNAVQIARYEGADRYASDTLRKAEELLRQAQTYQDRKMEWKEVVTVAREAAQAAEDARVITVRKLQQQRQPAGQQTTAEPAAVR